MQNTVFRGYNMQVNSVSAEIILVQDNANAAALVLQNLGFRILHIGTTISVEGPETLWESVFNVSFVTRKKQILPGIEGGDASYRKAITDSLEIPLKLRQYISGVAFVEPPEFF